MPTFANQKISIRRKSNMGIAIGDTIKMATFHKILHEQVAVSHRQIIEARTHIEDIDKWE